MTRPVGPGPDEMHLSGRWARKSWAVWFGDADHGRLIGTFRSYYFAARYLRRMETRHGAGWFCVVPTGFPPSWVVW